MSACKDTMSFMAEKIEDLQEENLLLQENNSKLANELRIAQANLRELEKATSKE